MSVVNSNFSKALRTTVKVVSVIDVTFVFMIFRLDIGTIPTTWYCDSDIIINRGALIFVDFVVHLKHENKNQKK